MKKYVGGFAVLLLCSPAAIGQQPKQAKAPPQPMSFFVTSTPKGSGANYGGLAGADQRTVDF